MTPFSRRNNLPPLFFRVPAELEEAFMHDVTVVNLSRAKIFAPSIAALNAVIFLLSDVYFALNGFWEQKIGYAYWAALHFSFMVSLFVVWIFLRAQPSETPNEIKPFHLFLFWFYFIFTVAGCLGITLVDQQMTGAITIYILSVVGMTATHYFSLRTSIIIYAGYQAAFYIALPFFQKDGVTLFAHFVGATILMVLMWLFSRLLFSLKAQEFLNIRTIEAQAADIRNANAELSASNAKLAEANAQLLEANDSLLEANRMKMELLNIAVNDLKTPLGSMGEFIDMLIDNTVQPAQQPQFFRLIRDITVRLSHTIDELLNVKSIESGAIKLNRRPIDVSQMVRLMISRHEIPASQKQQSIVLTHSETSMASIDEDHIYEVIDHLLNNAIKYSPNHKQISVSVRRLPVSSKQLPVEGNSLDTGHWLLVTVKDEGQGLTPDDMKKLFGKFQKLSATPTGGESSTGLGLSIAKQLVELHGGRIWAESAGKNKGTTFFVSLPALVLQPQSQPH
jgi:signal transduction histidine kinase